MNAISAALTLRYPYCSRMGKSEGGEKIDDMKF